MRGGREEEEEEEGGGAVPAVGCGLRAWGLPPLHPAGSGQLLPASLGAQIPPGEVKKSRKGM